jgi:TolA-binding protein
VPNATLLLGRAWLGVGLHERALETFRKAQRMAPSVGRPNESRLWEAEALFRLKRYAEARSLFDELYREDPAAPIAPDALYGLAWVELESKKPDAAIKYFREVIATYPDNAITPSATLYLARTLIDAKKYDDAQPLLADFPARYPNHALRPDAQYYLGLARVRGGDVKNGVADLRAFADANPRHELAPSARQLAGQSAARVGTKAELEAAYQKQMKEAPTPEGLYEAATNAERRGATKDQEAALRRLRKEYPEHELARRAALDLANIAFKRKDWKDATTLARAAAQTEELPVRAEALLLGGEADLKLNRYADAVKAFQDVTKVEGVDAAVRFRALAGLGLAHEEQQNLKSALSAYESVATDSPDSRLRDWAKERVKAVRARLAKTKS